MNAKTAYSMKELTKRSTTQLIAIYNRVFNTNVWDELFNPYEARQEMILALYAETQAAEVLARWEATGFTPEPYEALRITVTNEGIAIVWNTAEVIVNNRKFSDDVVAQVRALREDGESVDFIAKTFNMPKNRVYRICRGDVYNSDTKTRSASFKAARTNEPVFVAPAVRSNNAFWASFGL